MKECEECEYLEECNSLNIPKEVIARIICLIKENKDDKVIESIIFNEFNFMVGSRGYTLKMLRKYFLELEDRCIKQRENSK